jgi:hypothetical protein
MPPTMKEIGWLRFAHDPYKGSNNFGGGLAVLVGYGGTWRHYSLKPQSIVMLSGPPGLGTAYAISTSIFTLPGVRPAMLTEKKI